MNVYVYVTFIIIAILCVMHDCHNTDDKLLYTINNIMVQRTYNSINFS